MGTFKDIVIKAIIYDNELRTGMQLQYTWLVYMQLFYCVNLKEQIKTIDGIWWNWWKAMDETIVGIR